MERSSANRANTTLSPLPAPRVALIFGEYNHPVQPYLKSWAEALRGRGLQCSVYSWRPVTTEVSRSVQVLGSTGRAEKIVRLASWLRRWPHASLEWLTERDNQSLRGKLSTWAQIGPLVVENYDIVHLVNSYLYPRVASFLNDGKPHLIVSFRGHDTVVRPWSEPKWCDVLGDMYRRSKYLHFVSKYLRDQAIALGAPAERCVVIYPGVDAHFFDPVLVSKPEEANGLNLITVGRLTWEKGHIYALHAVKELLEMGQDVTYRIVGSGIDQAQLSFWAHKLGISSAVAFLGHRDPSETRELLASSHVYLQPSISEAIGVAVMEASAMQLPVVATSAGGLPELVEHRVTGLVVPPADPKALVKAILQLAQNQEQRTAMGAAGRSRVTACFSLEHEVKQWSQLYRLAMLSD